MKKNRLHYWVDVSIGVAFALSAVSGLIFLLPVGSDSGLGSGILGISYRLWDQLHTWSSLAMIAGVLAHLVLHWKWIVGMTKKMALPTRSAQERATSTSGTGMTRRRFLSLGFATVAAAAIAAGCAAIAGARITDTEQEGYGDALPADESEQPSQRKDGFDYSAPDSGSTEQKNDDDLLTDEAEQLSQQQPDGVACPRGFVNDPYPGRCRNYTDSDGDGMCDYSAPGSGDNPARS